MAKILICDDNPSVRVTLGRALSTKPGIDVAGEASTYEELAALAESVPPDVILMDVNMPGTNGVDAIAGLRATGIEAPVIMMSADQKNRMPALEAGAVAFFYKGTADFSELLKEIKAIST